MHTQYHTDAYILKSYPHGESNKTFILLTKDFGLVRANAQGIRLHKSKLKFSLQEYSKAHITLIKGKAGWKITTAQPLFNIYKEASKNSFELIVRSFSLLIRLLQGEERNTELYEIINQGILFLIKDEADNHLDIECVLILRILNNLGYVSDNKGLTFFTIDNDWDNDYISGIKDERQNALVEINRALKESQL